MYHLYTDMPLIEGVGDEVTIVFVILLLVVILCIAWVSTNIQELPFFSVIVIEFTRRRNRNSQQNTEPSTVSDNNGTSSSADSSSSQSSVEDQENVVESPVDNDANVTTESQSHENGNSQNNVETKTENVNKNLENSEAGVEQNSESDHEDLPASETELRQRRVAFYSKRTESVESKSEICLNAQSNDENSSQSSSNSQNTSEQETRNVTRETISEEATSSDERTSANEKVTIRLKYLNETQRNVEASLEDTIDQFRRTHFAEELEANKLVRFIFNGQDLRNGSNTLQAYNIVDNSVIHCLITQANRQSTTPTADHDEEGFDVGMLMFPCFGIILCFMWFLRFEYRQFFSGTSTVCLIGMTLLYIAALLAIMENRRRGQRNHIHAD